MTSFELVEVAGPASKDVLVRSTSAAAKNAEIIATAVAKVAAAHPNSVTPWYSTVVATTDAKGVARSDAAIARSLAVQFRDIRRAVKALEPPHASRRVLVGTTPHGNYVWSLAAPVILQQLLQLQESDVADDEKADEKASKK